VLKPWWRYIGPWPLRLMVVFIFVFVVTVLIYSGITVSTPMDSLAQSVLYIIAPGLVAALVATGVTWLGRRFLCGLLGRSLLAYLAFLLLIAVAAIAGRYAVTQLAAFPVPDTPDRLVGAVLRYWGWLIGGLALTGATIQRLRQETEVAQEALEVARVQQSLLLESEESSRRQVAQLLHDRVQAGIIAASLELRLVDFKDAAADRARLAAVVDRLETLRGIDVHEAVRILSPDLVNVDLRSAIVDLARGYEPTMVTRVDISPELLAHRDVPEAVLLAVYRIVEQGLLNAAGHGAASSVRVSIGTDDAGVVLSVADDGRGLPNSPRTPGLGSMVMDAWCRIAGGSWSLERGRPSGAMLRATIPVHP
jgi:two-component system, NarL family, sensor histidine kinase UhpB